MIGSFLYPESILDRLDEVQSMLRNESLPVCISKTYQHIGIPKAVVERVESEFYEEWQCVCYRIDGFS